jgi:hypothetical protein
MTKFSIVLALAFAGCTSMAHRMNQPSKEQTAQADADASTHCISGVKQIKSSFCDKPPSPVPQAWIDNATSSRNSMAQTCRNNPEQMRELDICLEELKAGAK